MAVDFASADDLSAQILTGALHAAGAAQVVFLQAFSQSPVVVVAICLAAAVPMLALFGLLLPRKRRSGLRGAGHDNAQRLGAARGPERQPVAEGKAASTMPEMVLRLGAATADPACGPVRVGADPSCHLRIDGPGVEALHALVTSDAEHGVQVVRLASDDGVGVYVNGTIVTRGELSGGETIKIGHNILVFDAHEAPSSWSSIRGPVEAAANPGTSAVAAARRTGGADSERASWRVDETAGAISGQADHSSVH